VVVATPFVPFADVVFVDVGGIPHIRDSVSLTNLSFGLLGLHIAAFCCGVNDVIFPWPLAMLRFPNSISVNTLAAKIKL
jgi:hypothetical protein